MNVLIPVYVIDFSSIMRLSNELVYGGALVCASNAVSHARLAVTASKAVVSILMVQ